MTASAYEIVFLGADIRSVPFATSGCSLRTTGSALAAAQSMELRVKQQILQREKPELGNLSRQGLLPSKCWERRSLFSQKQVLPMSLSKAKNTTLNPLEASLLDTGARKSMAGGSCITDTHSRGARSARGQTASHTALHTGFSQAKLRPEDAELHLHTEGANVVPCKNVCPGFASPGLA